MPSEDCGCDGDGKKRLGLYAVGGLVIAVLLIIFLFWAIARPSKPSFVLKDATLYAFNLNSTEEAPRSSILTTTLQVTVSASNPNGRIGIYYLNAYIYASYRNQQISLPTSLPTTYQGHKDVAVWSPFLYGNSVPVSFPMAEALQQDLNTGMVLLSVKIEGRIKWKVGIWVSGKYHFNVNCPAYIKFSEKNSNGVGSGAAALAFQLLQGCTVEV